jgi:hypothetical protein
MTCALREKIGREKEVLTKLWCEQDSLLMREMNIQAFL